MDYWVQNEVRARRDEVAAGFRKRRSQGDAEVPRLTARIAVANAAQVMSDTLAALARSLRRGEAA